MEVKKEKKRWGLMLFVVLIMIGTSFSFVFIGFSPAAENVKYNGIKFTKIGDRWEAKIDGRIAAFTFLPEEVKDVNVDEGISNKFKGKYEIDATSDKNSTYKQSIALAQHQMGLTLEAYNIYLRKGFTTNNTFNLPVITCSDATSSTPVIYFQHSNLTSIHSDGNCIIAEASLDIDFMKVKDRLLYEILGII